MISDPRCSEQIVYLTQQLQEQLQDISSVPLVVRCAVWKQRLVVLGIHAVDRDPAHLFTTIAAALKAIPIPSIPQCPEGIQLCLKKAGQPRIYATHYLSRGCECSPQPPSPLPHQPDDIANRVSNLPVRSAPVTHVRALPTLPSGRAILAPKPRQLGLTIVGMVVLGGSLWGGVYLAMRPCVFGECLPIMASQAHGEQIQATIRQATTAEDLVTVQAQLEDLIASLRPIPIWSPYFGQAARQRQGYQQLAQHLTYVITALEQATHARQQLNHIHSLPEWDTVQTQLTMAVAQLERVSPDSSLYGIVAHQLPVYQALLAEVLRHSKDEQQAAHHLLQAKHIADIALARQEIASNPESWQFVQTTWLSAIKHLQAIPTSTMAYAESTGLLADYQTHADRAHDTYQTAVTMATAYNRALELVDQAKALEHQGQPTAAQVYWHQAIAQIQTIPRTSPYYPQAQALVGPYRQLVQE